MEQGVYGGCLLCPLYPLLLKTDYITRVLILTYTSFHGAVPTGIQKRFQNYNCKYDLRKKKLFYLPQETYLEFSINPRTYTQIHTPTVVQGVGGGWMEPLPGVFDVLQDFETILPLVESLWSS